MNVINTLNWIGIGLLGIYTALLIFSPTKGLDAAGKGMQQGFMLVAIIALLVLVGLNLLPYRWSKITTFVLLLSPIWLQVLDRAWMAIRPLVVHDPYAGQGDGSYWFPDEQRRKIGRAIADGEVEKLRELLREPVPLLNDYDNEDSLSLLDFAAMKASYPYHGHTDRMIACMQLLVEAGAQVKTEGSTRKPPHLQNISNCKPEVLAFLLRHGADPNAVDVQGIPVLYGAIRSGGMEEAAERVRLLLESGADPNALYPYPDQNQYSSPLLYAASFAAWDACLSLIEHGAQVDYQMPQGPNLDTFLQELKEENGQYPEYLPESFYKLVNLVSTPN